MQGNGLSAEQVLAIINGADEGERGMLVEFSTKEVEDAQATAECGYQQFKSEIYVSIQAPGDTFNRIHRKVTNCGQVRGCGHVRVKNDTPCDIHRFPRQYAAYFGGLDQIEAAGMPLSAWPGVTKAEVLMLKARSIHTVEQLAAVPDSSLSELGPIRRIRQAAVDYIQLAKGQAPLQKLRAEIEAKDNRIEVLERNLKELGDRFEAFQKQGGVAVQQQPEQQKQRARQ